jgi:hypothetical protein
MSASCNCGVCLVSAVLAVAVIVVSIKPHVSWQWTTLSWMGAAAVVVSAVGCGAASRARKCREMKQNKTLPQGKAE